VLVAGLLLVGTAAGADGLFEAAGTRIERLPGGGATLLAWCLTLVAVTTAFLNLDTAVVFLTPVLVHVARRRGLPVAPFLYGCVLTANASSLFLPGSNLTNLLVLDGERISGWAFFTRMAPMAFTATLVTAAGMLLVHRRALASAGPAVVEDAPLDGWAGIAAAAATVIVLLATRRPALPVLAIGLLAAALQIRRARLTPAQAWRAVNPPVLVGLFALAVALGTLARAWSGPRRLIDDASAAGTTAIAALLSIVVNNLPATVLLTAHPVAHQRALLLGVNVGPNLAVTGSLAVYLWAQAARGAGCRVSITRYSLLGAPLAAVAIAVALGADALLGQP
jgi:arsenical pump membrane protein